MILDGNLVANEIKQNLVERVSRLSAKGITPCLATILVGNDPASETYVRMKGNACRRLGIDSRRIELDKNTSTEQLIQAIQELNQDIQIHGILLRSPILGKPVSLMLLNRNATVTICHSKTRDLGQIVGLGDIVVAAVGKPKFIQGQWIKTGAVILDAGYNEGNIGDVDYEACYQVASAITPVPAGVGPVTIATLLKHTVYAAEQV